MSANSDTGRGLFVRKATGLVRELGIFDMFVLSVNNQNIGLGVLFILLYLPALYFGADMIWSTIIAGVLCLFPIAAFALLNTIMPRSGGDYVWVSRVFGSWVGFAVSWNIVVWAWFYIGAPLAYVCQYGFASLFRYIGVMSGNLDLVAVGEWFNEPWGQFIVGTLLLILFTYMFITGTRRYMAFQNFGFILATLGLVAVVIVMLTTTQDSFKAAFNNYVAKLGGDSQAYDTVLTVAQQDPDIPYESPTEIDWGQTFGGSVWGIYIMAFAFYAAYLGGEIKSARTTNMVSMPFAVIFVTLFVVIVLAVFVIVPGKEWLGALYYFDPENYLVTSEQIGTVLGMGFTPTFSELAAIAAPPIVGIFIGVAFLFWTYAWMPISMLASTRPVMAWSFDRLLPESLSDVHPKFHTPVNAIILGAVAGEIGLALISFTDFGLFGGTFGEFLVLGIVCLVAIVLPYRMKDLYDGSAVAWRVAGIPVLTIIGVLGLAAVVYMEYLLWSDPIFGLAYDPLNLWSNAIVFLSGFAIYPIIYYWRKRQGIDVSLAAKEIPPE